MADTVFDTPIERDGDRLTGPWRKPRQMLSEQSYDGHASIHDDDTAQKLGFRGGTIEGPTHFSQFDPLCHALWGDRWFAHGCISAHYRSPVFEGEAVRAIVDCPADATRGTITMEKEDGTEVLAGSVSIGPDHPKTALEERLETLRPLEEPVILSDIEIGMTSGRIPVAMAPDQHMGHLYPFTLDQKRERMTEPSPVYDTIIPIEMVSVLMAGASRGKGFPTRGPAVGLFADQEIRMIDGPLKVSTDYEIEREIVAMSGSRRTESMWVRTRVYHPGGDEVLAEMLLNTASLKASFADYEKVYAELYGG